MIDHRTLEKFCDKGMTFIVNRINVIFYHPRLWLRHTIDIFPNYPRGSDIFDDQAEFIYFYKEIVLC